MAGWLLLLAGCHEQRPAKESASTVATAVRVVKPALRNLTHTVAQPGYVMAYEQTSVFSKVSGFIKGFSADIGQQVKKGDVLAEILVPELEEELLRKQAQVELDKQGIEHAQRLVQVAQSDVETAIAQFNETQANVGKSQAEVVRWESELPRLTQMVQERVVDRQVLGESQKQLDAAKAAHEAAKAAVAARAAKRLSAEAEVAKSKVDVEVAKSKVKVSEADARQTAAMLTYTKVTAPYDAVVTVRNTNTGDFVSAAASGDKAGANRTPLFVVARTDKFRVAVDVPEAFARYVHEGTKAVVRAEALNGIEIPATVARTSWSLDEKSRTLRAEIDLPGSAHAGLRPGMYVYGKITIDRPQIRILPQEALQVQGNQTYCFLRQGDKAIKASVQRGISEGPWVEVLKKRIGETWTEVTGDEEVILGDLGELVDGQTVCLVASDAK